MNIEPIAECRQWWKLWSVRLAACAGLLATVLAANPSLVLGLLAMFPNGPLRWLASAGVGLVVFVVPTLTRLLGQPKLKEGDDA